MLTNVADRLRRWQQLKFWTQAATERLHRQREDDQARHPEQTDRPFAAKLVVHSIREVGEIQENHQDLHGDLYVAFMASVERQHGWFIRGQLVNDSVAVEIAECIVVLEHDLLIIRRLFGLFLLAAQIAGAWWAVRRYELSYWAASAKKLKNGFERYGQKRIKTTINNKKGVMLWAADVCSRAAFAQPGPVFSISLGRFFSVRVSETDPRPGTWLRSGRFTCSARTGFRAVTTPLANCEIFQLHQTSTKGTMDPEGSSRISCDSWAD